MKKLTLFAAIFMFVQSAIAGGILTNTNQSAQFVRMLSRNASTQLDAVYFNPAGVVKLDDGFHFALHNQSVFQTRTITSGYSYLNDGEYEGKISAPLFPDVYAAWKKNNLAVSLMFGPVGGGGGATYDEGLPSFEKDISSLVPNFSGLSALGHNVGGYGVDISFEGTSIFWGLQGGVTYGFGDIFSVYGGVRYLPSTNTYSGYIKNIELAVNGNNINAQTFLNGVSNEASSLAEQAAGASEQLGGIANNLQPLIDQGAGSLTLAQIAGAGYIDAATKAQIEGGLQVIGLSSEQIAAINISGAQSAFSIAAHTYSQQSATLLTQAATLAGTSAMLGDKDVEVKQTGAGITPILGVNITPFENLNIGIKYEHKTTLKLTNETTVDNLGMFPDGDEVHSDLPALLGIGVGYKLSDAFTTQLSFTEYFDKGINWGKNVYGEERTIDKNSYDLALGFQYNLSDAFAISIGGSLSGTGVSEQYQADFSFSNSSTTGGLGFEWKITDDLTLDTGALYTFYKDDTKAFPEYKETYDKKNIVFAVGLGYSIF